MSHPGIVLVTTSSKAEAQKLADHLVHQNLAACVSILPIDSTYRWQGKICHDTEYQLQIKTDLALFSNLATQINERHTYDVPEIIAIPIVQGNQPYLDWLQAQVESP